MGCKIIRFFLKSGLSIFVLALFLEFSVFASGGIIAGSDVKLRSGPGNMHSVYSVLPSYTRVNIIGVSGEWAAIKVLDTGISGFVTADSVLPSYVTDRLPPSNWSSSEGDEDYADNFNNDLVNILPPVDDTGESDDIPSDDVNSEDDEDKNILDDGVSEEDKSNTYSESIEDLLSIFGDGENATEDEKEIVSYAYKFLGKPYVYGGTGEEGFDCSGLVYAVYSYFGYKLPRVADMQSTVGTWVPRSDLRLGDLVFFRTTAYEGIGHVGIYVGEGKFIHAPRYGYNVKVTQFIGDDVDGDYFFQRYVTARRILK